jgi:hypothetical protein
VASRAKKIGVGCLFVVALLAGLLFLSEPGKAILDIWSTGAVQAAMSEPEKRAYHASTEANLKAIYTAMKIYEESEGMFPDSSGWMDAIQSRLAVNDMTDEEAAKKLVTPSLAGKADEYGYAMNRAASAKYSGDLDPKMPLIFDSRETSRNAAGAPEELLPKPPRAGQNMGISVDGTLLELP